MYLEYIWIDGDGGLRCKTKIYSKINENIEVCEIPIWNFDGSSTNQADGEFSEVYLRPQSLFKDPFRRKGNNYLILCDTMLPDGKIHPSNTRYTANNLFEKYLNEKPMFGIEQEFFIKKNNDILNLPKDLTIQQTDNYCGTGGNNSVARKFIEEVLENALYSGLSITGMNAEVAPSQWEIQICDIGIKACDQLYILRYILRRTAERYNWNICLDPKPIDGEWNGSGCHVNFSTEKMRNHNGIEHILKTIKNLSKTYKEDIKYYGKDNQKRLTGLNETSSINEFTSGVANRKCSIRIPCETDKKKCGYFEDRRPSSNMDPYLVTSILFKSSIL